MTEHSADSTYMIRTKDGDKGPFSRKQICKLVVKGQLPESVSVRDTQNDVSVLVADIVSGRAYQQEFENEALGIASELMEEVSIDPSIEAGYESGRQQSPVGAGSGRHKPPSSTAAGKAAGAGSGSGRNRVPRYADEHGSVGTGRRRTQSSKRRANSSSRIMESEVSETQRLSRGRRKNKNQQMYLMIGVVSVCAIIAIVLLMIPNNDMKGRWVQGNQELFIGERTIQITEGAEKILHDYYKLKKVGNDTILQAHFEDDRSKLVDIKVIVDGESLTTTYDGRNPLFWTLKSRH